MKINRHIVAENDSCLCGIYNGQSVTCNEILEVVNKFKACADYMDNPTPSSTAVNSTQLQITSNEFRLLSDVILGQGKVLNIDL